MSRSHFASFAVFSLVLTLAFSIAAAGVLLVPPTSLTAVAISSHEVDLTWSDTNTLETGFTIQRSLSPFTNYKTIGTAPADTTTYRDLKAVASRTYYYRVRAIGPQKSKSAFSNIATASTPAPDSTPPSVSLMAPVPGTTVTSAQTVVVEATASDNVGVARVDFYDGPTMISSVSSAPYSFGWNVTSADNGQHDWSAKAFDASGNSTASPLAGVTVSILVMDTTPPSVPAGVTATVASCSQINVGWSASTDTGGSALAGYRVYRNGTQVGTSSTTSYASTGLAGSTAYSFTVAAYDNAGNVSAPSTAASATTSACTDTTAPSSPAGVTATVASCSQINVGWSASTDTGGSGLAGYRIYRNGTQVGTSSTSSFASTGLAGSTAYSFTVAAYDNAGNVSAQSSAASATTSSCPDTTAPSIPTGVTATVASCSQINVGWSVSTDTGGSGLAGYRIYRNGTQVGTSTTTSFSSTGLAGATAYSFTVAAYDNAGNVSALSTAASATTSTCPDTTAPSIPAGVTATVASCSQVNVDWSVSTDTGGSGLAGYRIYRNGTQVGTSSTTSYASTGLAGSTAYSFTVAAYDNAGNVSAPSTAASATTSTCPDTTAPSIPAGVTATVASCSQVNVDWSVSTDTGGSGLAGYRIYRNGTQVGTSSTTSFASIGLAASTAYSFTVAAYDNAGNVSAPSTAASATTSTCPDTTAPSIPAGVTATVASCSQVNVGWSVSTDTGGSGLAGYRIYRNGTQVGISSTTSYASTGLAGSTAYSFTVAAYDNAGNVSAPSSTASATTSTCPDTTAPSIPAGVTATVASCSQINVGWSASTDTGGSGLAGYRIYRNGTQVGTSSTSSFASTGLAASTAYSFTVAAYDNAGNVSAPSSTASATTSTCPDTTAPSIPAGVTATVASCSQVNVDWSVSTDTGGSGLAGYRIYRNGTQVGTSSTTSFASTGLAASTAYSFTVAAYDNAGNVSAPSTAASATTSSCPNQPPVANAGSDQTASVGTPVSLSGSASRDPDGSIVSYAWDFGDSTTGSGVSVTHTYNVAGTYWVTLTVTDNAGARGTDQAYVDVRATISGQLDWVQGFGGPAADIGRAVATEPGGDIVTIGQFSATVDLGRGPMSSAGGYDVFLARYTSTGTLVWSDHFGGIGSDIGLDVAVDANGDVLATGTFQNTVNFGGGALTSAGAEDIFLAKYSGVDGHQLWSKRFGGTGHDFSYSIAVDSGGDVLIAGSFQGSVDFGCQTLSSGYGGYDSFVAKYSGSDGSCLWIRNFFSNGDDVAYGVAVDGNDDVFVTGYFFNRLDYGNGLPQLNSTTGKDIYLAKLSGVDGLALWAKSFGLDGDQSARDIVVDRSGNPVLTGFFGGSVNFGGATLTATGFNDSFVAKFSGTNGAHIWSRNFVSSYDDLGQAIALDGSGNIIVVGSFNNTINFGGTNLVSNGSVDIFIAKLSGTTGSHLWSHSYGALYDDIAYGVATNSAGDVIVTGQFGSLVDFGTTPLNSAGSTDIFLLQLWP